MGPGETMAVLAGFGVVIGALITAGEMFKRFMAFKERQIETTAKHTARYVAENQALVDRVAVLERIVTDKGYDVATQIEALRDTRRIEEADAGVPLGIEKRENV